MTEKDAIIIIGTQLSILGFFAFILGWRYISYLKEYMRIRFGITKDKHGK